MCAAVFATSVTACGKHSPAAETLHIRKPGVVLVVGDSLLFQSAKAVEAAGKAAGWRVVVDGRPGSKITGGFSVDSWPAALAALVRTEKPDVAVVELGTNGCGNCTTTAAAIDADLTPLRHLARVYWVNVKENSPIPPDPRAMNAAITDATTRWPNLRVIDMNARFADHPELLQSDHIHFLPAGEVAFAKLVVDSLPPLD